jgi:hypothetical protein
VDGEIGPQLLGDVDREAALFATSSTHSSVQVSFLSLFFFLIRIRIEYMYYFMLSYLFI